MNVDSGRNEDQSNSVHIFQSLDDGKIGTGKPDQFDGKNPWVSGEDFPLNQSNELMDRKAVESLSL